MKHIASLIGLVCHVSFTLALAAWVLGNPEYSPRPFAAAGVLAFGAYALLKMTNVPVTKTEK